MVINSGEKSPFEIRDSTGKEFKEIYDNQGRLLFKNWNEIQGSPPITFRGYGKNLTECRIYGNTVQNGTPSPEAPVDAVGCGAWDETQQSYKLHLAVNGTEYPIYLGQVETTRRIHKMRLRNPSSATQNAAGYRLTFQIEEHIALDHASCKGLCNIATWNDNYHRIGFVVSGRNIFITQNIGEWATKESARQWFEENDVYIWYVLAEPETGIVNEPIQKIGDYSDKLSIADVPTINGINTISADTTVQPSEMYLKGKIKPVT